MKLTDSLLMDIECHALCSVQSVLKIEVFSALQMGFGASKNSSGKIALQNIIQM
jgi:hypothetical protein